MTMFQQLLRVRVNRLLKIGFAIALAAVASGGRSDLSVSLNAQSSCAMSNNPVACENAKPGTPSAQWDVSGAGDSTIQGFATAISVAPGATQTFKIKTTANNYTIDIYRMGYYSGAGARKVASITPSATLPQPQPNCLSNTTTGLIDCGNWGVSASWGVPSDAVSGIYFARLARIDNGGASHIFFVVRESDAATHKSDVIFQTSDTTWQAYNQYGGNSLYVGSPAGRAYKVSYNRPITTRDTSPEDFVFNAEYPMVRWLEANGYDVSYISGVDTDRFGSTILTPAKHKLFLSVGHDEYWSGQQRANVEAARGAGLNLAFFSGNEVFWKTRWEASIDGSNTAFRTLVSYKETHANAVIDPADPPIWTGTWRDPRFSPPADGGRPENALTGQLFLVNDGDTTAITVPSANGKARFWRNTTVATLANGATATMPNGTLGYEWDGSVDNGFLPEGLIALSSTTKSVSGMLLDYGSSFGAGTVTHKLSLYRYPGGGLVFGAGTVQWSWGLDSTHDRGSAAADVRMQQATVNLFADMGAQPGTLQSGLVSTSPSTDTAAPTSTISSPVNNDSFTAGSPITVNGSAVDSGGGIVAVVQVSLDGGTTWKNATGTTSWSYTGTISGSGTVTIRSRSFDDSGNMETPTAGVAVNVTLTRTCPCSIWSSSTVPPAPLDDADTSSVELGAKWRAEISGYITGVRFYKGSANTGTHTGSLWTSTGTLLGTVTFQNETASGWQQATFASAIPVNANQTYVVTYHAPTGHYTGTDSFFTSAVDNPPLHALRDGADGPNGVYAYSGSTTFPTQTFASENYWVDVVFTTTQPADTTPPTITATFPANGAVNIDPGVAVTATFSEAMNVSTISSSTTGAEGGTAFGTFELHDPFNNLVPAAVSYDSTTNTASLTPQAPLGLSTTYNVLVKGGTADPRVKDLAGNAMAANVTWTFTTAATPPSCPCTIWSPALVPSPADAGDPASVVLGTRFRSDMPGFINGVRFYKATANTGTHVGALWSATGTLLASATFNGESATGWQQVSFATPVQIGANTSYVASYLAPNGHYAATDGYFAASGVDNSPLHALKDGADGPNSVYAYSSTNVFPTETYQSEGYFVDVVFNTTNGPDTNPPVIKSVSPANGASGVFTNATVLVTFNEALDSSTVNATNFVLKTGSGSSVPASVSYSAAALTVTLTPSATLAYSTPYTVTVKAGIKDLTGNATTSDYTSSFTTGAAPPPPPTEGPGGPVLVITSSANPFSVYYAEILRNEGQNAFTVADLSTVTSTVLSGYDLAILGQTALTANQVTMFTNWVNTGGNLIAMRPDKQLAGLLGLTDAASTLSDAYLLVNTAAGTPGNGIVNQTIQFHGTADRYALNGATSLAALYSNATTATSNPAVTRRAVGTGIAVAFTFDLARSIVYTRQGNPAWSGQERDGAAPIRSDDLYFGAKSGDVQPDWVDLSKVQIPQADEQQRFLWNIMLAVNATRKPLPRFWYFPRMLPAAVIMTGDDHGHGGTAGRFDEYIGFSSPGCNVSNWECIRGTSYLFPNTPISDAQVDSYTQQGFEIALHVNTNCADWTSSTLPGFYSNQIAQFKSAFTHAGAPTTNRTHCIVNSDYATQWQVELNNNIRLDTTYYYWPDVWVVDRPGMFTGSGLPMRFASSSGQMIDVYQAATQMTDESGQTFPKNINTLLDNAVGPLGYYGAFTANMHTDANGNDSDAWSTSIVNAAKSRNIPVITARQMLTWLDGRNGSSFGSISWNGSTLSFNVAVGAGASGLHALVPAATGTRPITGITLSGNPVAYTTSTIKGVQYAAFPAGIGSYQVSYGADTTPPSISGPTASGIGTASATIAWTTNEASTSIVNYGTDPASVSSSVSDSTLVTSHSIVLTGLTPNTLYYYRVTSADAAGNTAIAPATDPPASFTTAAPFIAGTVSGVGAGTTVTLSGAASTTTTTSGSGTYSFSPLSNGTYTVTPTRAGYAFSPSSRTVTLSGTGVSGVDFAAVPVTISGTVSPLPAGSGVTLRLSGAAAGTATSDASGNYSFSGVADGTYTLTPSKTGFTFTPNNRAVAISGANVTGQDFTAQALPTFTLSGTISPSTTGAGATVTLSGAASATTTTDSSGFYSFGGLVNGTYTVTPAKSGVTFTPGNQTVTINGANATATFTAQAVPLAIDATVTFGRSNSATTIGSGAFSTTASNELLLAFVAADNKSGTTSISGITGAGLTWTLVRRTNTQRGTAEIWRAFATTVLTNVTVTATINQSVAAAITVVSFKGVNTSGTGGSGAIGATGSGNAVSGAPTAGLTTTRANSLVIGVGHDWDNAIARTIGPNQTMVSQYLANVGDTFWVQRTTNPVPVVGTVVTINDTAPTTDRYNLTICEVLPAP